MALRVTLGRWIAIVAVGCALITLGVLRDDLGAPQPVSASSVRWDRTYVPTPGQLLGRAANRLRILELRDSVLATGAGAAARGGLEIRTDAALSDSTARQLRAMGERQWRAIAWGTATRVVLSFILDTVRTVRGARRGMPAAMTMDYFLPHQAPGSTCYVQVRLPNFDSPARTRWLEQSRRAALAGESSVFGPCAYFAVFGMPGDGVRRWLAGSGWTPATLNDWTRVSPPYPRQQLGATGSLERMFGFTDAWNSRYWLGPRVVACMTGNRASCSQALLEGNVAIADSAWGASVATSSTYLSGWAWLPEYRGMGPAQRGLLSDMVATLGRQRFQRFWSSPLSVDAAFHEAAGEDLGTWAQRWARDHYGTDTAGPTLSATGLLSGTLFAVAACALALLLVRRRQLAM